ncbi:metal-dependent phosphohydrolase [Acetivibrio cellulolyticus]|uniref:metal-dependent phosphohydrolase n=1 Tax=Acetivibrio cellulolyticus TaxID=35830 RepID=UPI0001E2E781|nr:metal-dependent phosphohydrolase [Acetivibrio cellulolyticus]
MFLKRKEKNTHNDVVAKIRGEIIQSLKKKGISFSEIDVDFRQENVSLKLSINEK